MANPRLAASTTQQTTPQECSDWDRILATERCLGIRSGQGYLICHRQGESVFESLFTQIARLHSEFAGQTAEQICESSVFQVRCDETFEDLGPSIWKGPEVLWLIEKSEHGRYVEGTSVNMYWHEVDREDKEGMRYYFHELVGLYLANAERTTENAICVRPFNGLPVELGKLHFVRELHGSSSTSRRQSSSKPVSVAASVKNSRRHRKKPQRFDDDDDDKQWQPPRVRTLNSLRPGRDEAEESLSSQTGVVEASTSSTPRPPKYNAPRKSAPSLGSRFEAERRFGIDTDSLYRSTPPPRREPSTSVAHARVELRSPASGITASRHEAPVLPGATNEVSPGSDALAEGGVTPAPSAALSGSEAPVMQSVANSLALEDDTLPNSETNAATEEASAKAPACAKRGLVDDDRDDDEPEPPIKQESYVRPGDSLGNSIMVSDDEDDNVQRSNRQRPSNIEFHAPPSLSGLDMAGSEPPGISGGVFEGRRARVVWGPKAPFDDIIALSSCSDAANFVRRIEAMKLRRRSIRNDRITAAGMKLDGRACFRILWEDAEPGFEELAELVQSLRGGQKFDLGFEIEWEDEEQRTNVKMEDFWMKSDG